MTVKISTKFRYSFIVIRKCDYFTVVNYSIYTQTSNVYNLCIDHRATYVYRIGNKLILRDTPPNSVNCRLSADIHYRPPNLREVYVPFTGNIRNPTKRRPSSHSLWNEARSSKLSEAVFINC